MGFFYIIRFLQLAYPDITETDRLTRVTVHLQLDRTIAMLHNAWQTDILGSTLNSKVVEQQHAIVDQSDGWVYLVCAILVEDRSVVDDVINIPLTWLTHGICQRTHLFVDATCLTV